MAEQALLEVEPNVLPPAVAEVQLFRCTLFMPPEFVKGACAMNIQEGDQVLVNLAPFIGSRRRSKEAIPCRVIAIDGPHIEISTHDPYRELSLWVEKTWIDVGVAREAPPTFFE